MKISYSIIDRRRKTPTESSSQQAGTLSSSEEPGEPTTRTSNLKKNTRNMCLSINNFYLCNPMERYEYMKMRLIIFPQHVFEEYDWNSKVHRATFGSKFGVRFMASLNRNTGKWVLVQSKKKLARARAYGTRTDAI